MKGWQVREALNLGLKIEMFTFAANQNTQDMYGSEDLESFYFQYQTKALPHGEFLWSFCVKPKASFTSGIRIVNILFPALMVV